jgi:hypothetical protein
MSGIVLGVELLRAPVSLIALSSFMLAHAYAYAYARAAMQYAHPKHPQPLSRLS